MILYTTGNHTERFPSNRYRLAGWCSAASLLALTHYPLCKKTKEDDTTEKVVGDERFDARGEKNGTQDWILRPRRVVGHPCRTVPNEGVQLSCDGWAEGHEQALH